MHIVFFLFVLNVLDTAAVYAESVSPIVESAGTAQNSQLLNERAVQRWNALINLDFQNAYEFETPGFRQANDRTKYQNFYGKAVKWKSIKIVKVDFIDDSHQKAKVTLLLGYDGPKPSGGVYQGQTTITETWLWENSNWWYVHS